MKKAEIIKQELQGFIYIPATNAGQPAVNISPSLFGYNIPVAIVNLDKLAEFLAKHLDIKPENLIEKK